MKQLPDHVVAYKRTSEFTEDSVPAGLLRAHHTAASVWAKIVVLEGQLQYTINEPQPETTILDKNVFGVVEPTVLHEVKPLGKVRFYVEFHR
ncbi:DUF1971 domain-containing protein [Oxalobacteraceae bacterium OM1]|nr:DUF1971 domain-containing protein [Oxalobacteraceae bacterium OM1]